MSIGVRVKLRTKGGNAAPEAGIFDNTFDSSFS